MKQNKKKKGFTIVELVIVIAVIAILAAVLIPTFSNVIAKANENAAMQAARNEYTNYMVDLDENIGTGDYIIESTQGTTKYYFLVVGGQFNASAVSSVATNGTATTEWTLDSKTYVKDGDDLTASTTGGNQNVAIYKAKEKTTT